MDYGDDDESWLDRGECEGETENDRALRECHESREWMFEAECHHAREQQRMGGEDDREVRARSPAARVPAARCPRDYGDDDESWLDRGECEGETENDRALRECHESREWMFEAECHHAREQQRMGGEDDREVRARSPAARVPAARCPRARSARARSRSIPQPRSHAAA